MENRENQIGYVTFILGYELLNDVLQNSMMHSDEAYSYCAKLAGEFIDSEYNDDGDPVYECLESFVNDKMSEIEEYLEDFDVSVGKL